MAKLIIELDDEINSPYWEITKDQAILLLQTLVQRLGPAKTRRHDDPEREYKYGE